MTQYLPIVIGTIWFGGFAVVLLVWFSRWRRMAAGLQSAVPLRDGKEVQALRGLERRAGIQKPIEMKWSRATFEPGIFGIWRPVLAWPGRWAFPSIWTMRNSRPSSSGVNVKMLLRMAYHVQDSQIIGGPNWINTDRYNIEAKADESTDEALRKMSEDDAGLVRQHMFQALLADRFQLKLHHETRELPVYALVVAKNGPKIEKANDEASLPHGAAATPGDPGGGHFQASVPGPGGPGPNRGVCMTGKGGEQQLSFRGTPLKFFAEVLAPSVGRTVVDKTGLEGRCNFDLHWVPEMRMMRMGGPGPGGPGGPAGPGGNEAIAGVRRRR